MLSGNNECHPLYNTLNKQKSIFSNTVNAERTGWAGPVSPGPSSCQHLTKVEERIEHLSMSLSLSSYIWQAILAPYLDSGHNPAGF